MLMGLIRKLLDIIRTPGSSDSSTTHPKVDDVSKNIISNDAAEEPNQEKIKQKPDNIRSQPSATSPEETQPTESETSQQQSNSPNQITSDDSSAELSVPITKVYDAIDVDQEFNS